MFIVCRFVTLYCYKVWTFGIIIKTISHLNNISRFKFNLNQKYDLSNIFIINSQVYLCWLGKYIYYNMFSTIYYIQQTKIVLHVYANY